MPDRINPYIAGAPVLESRMFFGREDVFSWIERSLSGKFVDHILVLHGQRRVGKTSVLKHLGNRLPKRYIPIFIDLQGRVNSTLPRFLWWLAREISRALDMDKPTREAFEDDPDYFESQFLPLVEEHLGDNVLLFTFDEFDTLESTSAQEGLALPFMAILKRLMEHKQLNFIFSIGSSGRKLENMQAAYTSFFKQALYRKISFLSENDARDLITKPVEGVISFDLDAVDRIYEITSGHPYFIQLICHELFSKGQKSNDWQVSKSDVEAILDAVIERGTVNLKFVWDESSELEKWVLASLAQFEESVDLGKLDDYLNKQKVRFIHRDLESAVLHLHEKDVLASGNRFVVYLLKLWLTQNRSMEQVREELTRVNPIVSRLLQVGHEYLDQGELEKAIDSFQEALQSDVDNLEVRMGLASAYMAHEDYGRAGVEYEETLAVYPEDVAAQSGYCNAYLALGDVRFAMGHLDEAEYAYQQVLKISPKHSDGRARMSQLFHHRAVSAISMGKDVALEQARRALEFMPKDKDLQASVRELEALSAGQGDIKAVLLSWGQRAKENEKWQDAADLLSAYQRLKGKDKHILSLLKDVRKKARAQELDGLKNQAQRLERLGQFDEAVFVLNKYLSLEPEDAQDIPSRIQTLKEARKQAQLDEGRAISKPFWKQPLALISIAVVAILSALLLIPDSPLRLALLPPAPTQEIVERVVVATQVPPTPTPEPLPYKWTRINSLAFAQRDSIKVIAVDPNDKEVIYVGMEWAGLYKTIDGGTSWRPIQEGLGRAQIVSIMLNQQDSNIVYVGTEGGGVYRSTNGGKTWEQINNGINHFEIGASSLYLDPQDNNHLLYYTRNHLYETSNGGNNWLPILLNEGQCPYEGSSVFISPLDPEIIIFIESKNFNDGCETGVYVKQGTNDPWNFSPFDFRIDWDPFMDNEHLWQMPDGSLIASVIADDLIISYDQGNNWELLSNLGGKCSVIQPVLSQPGVFYCGKDNDFYKTANYGKSLQQIYSFDTDAYNLSIEELYVDQKDPDHILLGGIGFFESYDGGRTWEEHFNGLGTSKLNLLSDHKGKKIFLESQYFSEYYYSEDYGLTWENLNAWGHDLAFDANGEYFYRLEKLDNKIYRYMVTNNNKTEIRIPEMNDPRIYSHLLIEENLFLVDANYFVDQSSEIYFSEDGGGTWEKSEGLDFRNISEYLYFSKVDKDVIYSGPAAHSSDGGKSWSKCNENPGDINGSVVIDPQDSNRLYLGTFGEGIKVSSNGCKSWQSINNGLGNLFINSIALDLDDPNIIYAGTDNGIYISLNSGKNWAPANEGLLGGLVINSVYISPVDHVVFAVTPLGIFRLEKK